MNEGFRAHVEQLHPKFEKLVTMTPISFANLPRACEVSGIYLLSEGDHHLYVGRSRKIRSRLRMHVGHYAGASFAVKLTREAAERPTSYTAKDSFKVLLADSSIASVFQQMKERIRGMQVRYVEEPDCNRQALLEIYATLSLRTPYNDFETH